MQLLKQYFVCSRWSCTLLDGGHLVKLSESKIERLPGLHIGARAKGVIPSTSVLSPGASLCGFDTFVVTCVVMAVQCDYQNLKWQSPSKMKDPRDPLMFRRSKEGGGLVGHHCCATAGRPQSKDLDIGWYRRRREHQHTGFFCAFGSSREAPSPH
jgi:hypothetical protein